MAAVKAPHLMRHLFQEFPARKNPRGVGAQWELPGACGARNRSNSVSFSVRPRHFDPAQLTGILARRGPSCTLPDRRETAFLARLSAAVRPPWLFPPLWIAKIAAGASDGTEPASRRLLR